MHVHVCMCMCMYMCMCMCVCVCVCERERERERQREYLTSHRYSFKSAGVEVQNHKGCTLFESVFEVLPFSLPSSPCSPFLLVEDFCAVDTQATRSSEMIDSPVMTTL